MRNKCVIQNLVDPCRHHDGVPRMLAARRHGNAYSLAETKPACRSRLVSVSLSARPLWICVPLVPMGLTTVPNGLYILSFIEMHMFVPCEGL